MNKVITIKVYETSRDRIKIKAIKEKMTMQNFIEELSKLNLITKK